MSRTVTTVNRLLDVLPMISADSRIQIVFTVVGGSQFDDGVAERVRGAGFRLIAWRDAIRLPWDLAISASDKGRLHSILAPLLLVQHGAGYHRRATRDKTVSGLAFPLSRATDTTVVVAHSRQLDVLRSVSREVSDRAIVGGDPCLDRMLASLPRRVEYRRALNSARRRLVVLASTWGHHSLWGQDPTLPERMLAELPWDEYRLALVLHPNVWARHGHWHVQHWLAPAIDAGLLVIPPEEGWRAALIAADMVISDHGSLTCYAAALGRPVLLGADGDGEVVSGSPMDGLRARLPLLEPNAPFAPQIDRAVDSHDPARTIALTDTVFAHRGEATSRLRAAIYRLLRLSPPGSPTGVDLIPVPAPADRTPGALVVHATVTERVSGHVTVTITRHPLAVHDRWRDADTAPTHLVAYVAEGDLPANESAAILVARATASTSTAARTWAIDALARFPGARIALAHCSERVVLRIQPDDEVQVAAAGTLDAAVWASAAHACIVSGIKLVEITRLTVRAGAVTDTADVTGP